MKRTDLIKRRKELKLSQKDVANELNLSVRTISRFEQGESDLKSENFTKLLYILKLDYQSRIEQYDKELARIDARLQIHEAKINYLNKLMEG
jgi:transcriptional regulator with XRE-family HTH domain